MDFILSMTDTDELLGELTYQNYKFNRERFPHIPPERWARVFGTIADKLEARYADECGVGEQVVVRGL